MNLPQMRKYHFRTRIPTKNLFVMSANRLLLEIDMSGKLKPKPCLFCKEKKDVSPCRYYGDYWKVDCLICGASGPKAKTEDEAIKKWNRGMSKDGESRAKRHMALGLNDMEHYMASCSELSVEKADLQADLEQYRTFIEEELAGMRKLVAEREGDPVLGPFAQVLKGKIARYRTMLGD